MEQLGRYQLTDKLGQGGMAEVYAARLAGPEGFLRDCVVKRMLPTLSAQQHHVAMFLEEGRLGAQLVHPHLVQTFDLGSVDGQYFLALEKVDGKSLLYVLDRLAVRGQHMPVSLCAWICARAAEGLHYAHELSDQSGRPLRIVHRDVSPGNVLLSRGGDVKVADFGIALADSDSRPRTRLGFTKGKLNYMAPEQARGIPCDRKTDVFGLGVVLWETLTGVPLYGDDRARRIDQVPPPPSSVRSEVDPALDAIVLSMLQPQAQNRTASCALVEEQLDDWLQGFHHGQKALKGTERRAGRAALGSFLRALLDDEPSLQAERPWEAPPPPGVSLSSPGAAGGAGPADGDLFVDPASTLPVDGSMGDADGFLDVTAAAVRPDAKTVVRAQAIRGDSDASGFDDATEATRPALALRTAEDDAAPPVAVDDAPGRTSIAVRGRAVALPPFGSDPREHASSSPVTPPAAKAGRSLPRVEDRFFGRQLELEWLQGLVDDGARLVTLSGPAGVGKSRLALAFAAARADAHRDPGGITWVALPEATSDAQQSAVDVVAAIARAVGLPLRDQGEALQALGRATAARGRALLVLDGADRQRDALAAVLPALLQAAPRAVWLVTAREPLAGRAADLEERVLVVKPLPVAPLPSQGARDARAGEDALALFFDRAQRRGARGLDGDEARRLVHQLVRRLEGVPLAVELFAARAAETPLSVLLAEVSTTHAAPADQSAVDQPSLRAAIAQSVASLSPGLQDAFTTLSAFAGPFDDDDAAAVLDLDPDAPGHAGDAHAVVRALLSRSLIVERGARFALYDLVRAVGAERLHKETRPHQTQAAVFARHAGHFAALGRRHAQRALRGDALSLLMLEGAAADLAAVVARTTPTSSPAARALAVECALSLEPAWGGRGGDAFVALLDDALRLIEAEVTSTADARLVRVAGRAWLARGDARRAGGNLDEARRDFAKAARHAVSPALLARAHAGLAAVCVQEHDLDGAENHLLQALQAARAQAGGVDDDDAIAEAQAKALVVGAKAARLARHLDEAARRAADAVRAAAACSDVRTSGRALVELASIHLQRGALDAAAAAAHEAVDALARAHDSAGLVQAKGTLAIIEVDRGNFDEAEAAAAHAADHAARLGLSRAQALYEGWRGCALHRRGDVVEARDRYQKAVRGAAHASDRHSAGFFAGALGAAHASLGDLPASRAAFADAMRMLRGAGRPPLLEMAVQILSLVRDARVRPDPAAHADWIARANAVDVGLGGSPAALSEEVRFALAIAGA